MAGCCLHGCNIISMIGFIYFGLNFIVFEAQKHFYEFHMEDPESTKIAFLISSLVYLGLFVLTLVMILREKKQKKDDNYQRKNFKSIHESPQLLKSIPNDKQPKQKPKGEYVKMTEEA